MFDLYLLAILAGVLAAAGPFSKKTEDGLNSRLISNGLYQRTFDGYR
jgi:hypothetical protein